MLIWRMLASVTGQVERIIRLLRMRRTMTLVTACAPPALIGALGMAHPSRLTAHNAELWQAIHIALLPLFPLLALGPWIVARAVHPALARVVAVFGFIYAICYTALDILSGMAAGALRQEQHERGAS